MRTIHSLLFLGSLYAANAAAVSTPLTYQGTLEDAGVAANGVYDFSFQLKTAGGFSVGAAVLANDVTVVGGVFTVDLDFGASAFSGTDRKLGISVRPGASVGAYTALTPDASINAAPYAQFSNSAASADQAIDVVNGSIDEVDIATSAVSTRTIASDAVGSAEIANGAVGNTELASNSVGVSKLIGANYVSPNNLNTTIGANSCATFDIGVAGGFEPGDWVVLNATTAIPANVIITPLEVVSTNLVKIRFCNNGNASAAVVNAGIRMISIR
jgi:hypothetical protein